MPGYGPWARLANFRRSSEKGERVRGLIVPSTTSMVHAVTFYHLTFEHRTQNGSTKANPITITSGLTCAVCDSKCSSLLFGRVRKEMFH